MYIFVFNTTLLNTLNYYVNIEKVDAYCAWYIYCDIYVCRVFVVKNVEKE